MNEKLGAALTCKRFERLGESHLPWQAFHVSRLVADRALAGIKTNLDAYEIDNSNWPTKVETPGGEEFSCWVYYD